MTAAYIERRWRPPDKEKGPGCWSRKPAPSPIEKLSQSIDIIPDPAAFASVAVSARLWWPR
jgi:hypothetical protein